jgi:hypothetical protein
MLRDIDFNSLPELNEFASASCLRGAATGPEPISHNTVRQLLLWYAPDRRLGRDAAQLLREDGLIEFLAHPGELIP